MSELPIILLRSPAPGEVELVIAQAGNSKVYPLSRSQVWLITETAVRALDKWPDA